MKFISMNAIMTRRQSFVCASFAVAMMVGAITFSATSPAFAGRQVHGSDVARLLSGRAFRIECVDGTIGRGQVSVAGVANVSYRRPSMSGPEETDYAVVRVKVLRFASPGSSSAAAGMAATRSPKKRPAPATG